MLTLLRFNTQRALHAVVPHPEEYMELPVPQLAALLVRMWPTTLSSKRHPYRNTQQAPDNIWDVDPEAAGMSADDVAAIQRQFQQECSIMTDALYNTPSHQDIVSGYREAEARVVHAHALTGELYSYPSGQVVVPTIHRLYGRQLTVMMTYSYHELMPLLQHPPAAWSPDVIKSLREQFRLDMALYAITPH